MEEKINKEIRTFNYFSKYLLVFKAAFVLGLPFRKSVNYQINS